MFNPAPSAEMPSRPAIDGHQVRFDEDGPERISKDLEEHEHGLRLFGQRLCLGFEAWGRALRVYLYKGSADLASRDTADGQNPALPITRNIP